jgi:hypothetical protein
VHEVDALPNEVIERIELPLPGAPVELIGPVGHEPPQPFQLGALFPAYAGHLVGPSRTTQPHPQVVEHLVRDMNPKPLHTTPCWLGPAERAAMRSGYHSRKGPCLINAVTGH